MLTFAIHHKLLSVNFSVLWLPNMIIITINYIERDLYYNEKLLK